ncbi:Peptidase S10, serine carboxypeptidase [Metarhizium album ARSEF 1941]|uniref:Carboxypeptidase n=1 Tax=Metarhizium album (strain ARSEF 1941) TaxID=1081103 RepID=A0A0B2WU44_METAS|nr:Peptidase S10, serine carboxypeptidase [Metarhizium album ARSEF 1941]KHN96987.1 Peptidase S10, serine carboxypeptidase [Metarhizium album ARSEF 1941]
MAPRLSWSVARSWHALAFLALWSASTLAAGKTSADYYVRELPGLPKDGPPIKMHAGHIEITAETNGNLFFWHFQNNHIANRQRTVIWLNGGPGCSSEDGALMEVGPYRVTKDNTLVLNNGTWNEFANLLFVDNPVGTGFSYVDTNSYVHELNTMATQFITFLEKFFALFPEYEHDDLYLAGESYAGQHIPYISKAILDRNKLKSHNEAWSLKGLLIGNGWISPQDQSSAYLKFSLQKGLIEKGSDNAQQLQHMQRICDREMSINPGRVDYSACEAILNKILQLTQVGSGDQACINMYDVRLRDSAPSCGLNWPPDLKHVELYLRQPQVISALNLDKQRNTGWQECSGMVNSNFRNQNSTASILLLPDILKEVPVLLFSGAEDLICNHVGTEELISNLAWNEGKGFEVTPGNWAPRRQWTFEGEVAGFWQEARNLTYVLFHNASHMVPFDYPRRSRDMLDRFMRVDISSIGGQPSDSRIDGEKGPDTSVGGAKNNTQQHEEETKQKLDEAKWHAYQRSGEVVLVIVIIAASAWGYFVWRQRRKGATYSVLQSDEAAGQSRAGLAAFHDRQRDRDLEAAAFDETTVDNIPLQESPGGGERKYSIGEDSDEEEEETTRTGHLDKSS